jgi:hypothetical protein
MILRQLAQYSGIQLNTTVAIAHKIKSGIPVTQPFNISAPEQLSIRGYTVYSHHIPTNKQIEALISCGMSGLTTKSQFFAKISSRSPQFDSDRWLRGYSAVREQLRAHALPLYVSRLDKDDAFLAELEGGMTGSHRMLLMAVKKLHSSSLLHYDLQFPRKYTTHPDFFRDHARKERIAIVLGSDTRHITGYIQKKSRVYLVISTQKAKNQWCIFDALPSQKNNAV